MLANDHEFPLSLRAGPVGVFQQFPEGLPYTASEAASDLDLVVSACTAVANYEVNLAAGNRCLFVN